MWFRLTRLLLACLPILLPRLLCAQEASHKPDAQPPARPILRIETGMHTAPIKQLALNADQTLLATASDDKTVRLWDLASGRLLQTFRPPLGSGNEGQIYTLAFSPDGSTLACAGHTGYEWDRSECIYLLDRASGQVMRRIPGLPNVIFHLAYSLDGRYLAAVMWGKNGLRVFRTSDGSLAGQDGDYGDSSYGLDFASDGRLVTSSDDGLVRLYSPDFHLLAKRRAPGDKQPFSIRFSPDGARIAVGYVDISKVSLLSANDLSPLASPDTHDIAGGDLSSVCWSADGSRLYAGGGYSRGTDRLIRCWEGGGEGKATDFLCGAHNAIFDLLPLKDGRLVFTSAEPNWGVLDASGHPQLLVRTVTSDFRDNWEGFLLSGDAASVQFGCAQFGKQPARFSLDRMLLEADPDDAPLRQGQLHPPLTRAEGMEVADWKYTTAPKLNGKLLSLDPYEMSRSFAITPDRQAFVLGTEWYIRCFGHDGKLRWRVVAPGVAWEVNVSGDGRLAIAAFGDGTIRWYRMTDGMEMLALFPHRDRKRWVAWTPSGYYACSPGGEDLLGWHLNRGKDQAADFFPASRFRNNFYRPDVVARILTTLDEAEAVKQADADAGRKAPSGDVVQQAPPVIRILSPDDNASFDAVAQTLRYTVRSPSGDPITGLRVLIDGRPLEADRSLDFTPASSSEETVKEVSVTLPSRDCQVSLIALNKNGASVPSARRLKWQGAAALIRPKLYVLAVGVSKYDDATLALDYAAADAKSFAELMQKQDHLYTNITVKTLFNGEAKKDEILDGLDWLQKQTTSHDVAMLFLAGHGLDDATGDYYFAPTDFQREKIKRTGLPFTEITNTLRALAGKAVFFVDTCHAGAVAANKTRGGGADLTGIVNELASVENGTVVFSASTGREKSQESEQWRHGAFTLALLEGLSGKADVNHTGRITITMLDAYITERVKALTQGTQHPTTEKPASVPDFPIAVP